MDERVDRVGFGVMFRSYTERFRVKTNHFLISCQSVQTKYGILSLGMHHQTNMNIDHAPVNIVQHDFSFTTGTTVNIHQTAPEILCLGQAKPSIR